ncbi:MAG TPA: hypothetical protein VIY27_10840, partial [Myxococcota bacterium]
CVGDYCDVVEEGTSEIYSVRDANGQPHVTMEYHPATERFAQIMGKQNEEPIDEYKARVAEFIDKGDLPVRPYDALTPEEAAMARAWGERSAEGQWERRGEWYGGDDEEPGVLAEWERRAHAYVDEELIAELFEYYPRGPQRSLEFPRFAFDDSVTLEEIEEQSDIHDLLVRQIEDAYKERWAELAQDDRDQIDYAIDDVAKELAGDDLGDDPAAVVREKVEAALDRRLGSHLWSGRDQTYATAMTLGRLADWEETA